MRRWATERQYPLESMAVLIIADLCRNSKFPEIKVTALAAFLGNSPHFKLLGHMVGEFLLGTPRREFLHDLRRELIVFLVFHISFLTTSVDLLAVGRIGLPRNCLRMKYLGVSQNQKESKSA